MPEYIVNPDYNDGYTAPELHEEAVLLMDKLNPQPLVRCRDCEYGKAIELIGCIKFASTTGESPKDPRGYCAWGERRDA